LNTSSTQLAPVFELLGDIWLHEFDTHLAERWNQTCGVFADITDLPAKRIDSAELDDLAVEFCRLFLGPKGHLPPIQSIWMTAQLESPSTKSMQQYCERLQYPVPAGVPCDHLGLELKLFATLLKNAPATDADEVLTEFQAAHLQWADDLLNRVATADSSGIYTQVARVTQQLLAEQ